MHCMSLTAFQARYFILRSSTGLDIEENVAHNVWTCGKSANAVLDNAYRKRTGPIMLIFSVVKRFACPMDAKYTLNLHGSSRQFWGVAEMTSPVKRQRDSQHWEEDTWTR